MRSHLIAIASAAFLVAGCGSEHGFYQAQAEANCRDRGLTAGTPAFERCVIEEERSVYVWVDRSGY